MMQKVSSHSLVRFSKVCEQGLWQRSAIMAMSKEVEAGGKTPAEAKPAEGEALRDDMGKSYGDAYSTRCLDEGYGERCGEAAVKVVSEKQSTMELKQVVNVQHNTSPGEHVEEESQHNKKGTSATS